MKNWKIKVKNDELKSRIVKILLFLFVIFIFDFCIFDFASAASLIKPANTVGMVGWWRLDEGGGSIARDSSGQGNTGNLILMEEVDWVAGHVGTALDLDGVEEYVNVGNDDSLNPTSVMSMVAWVKPRSFGSGVATILEREFSSSYLWYLNGAGGDMIVNLSGTDAESDLAVITLDVWQHVAVVYQGGTVTFYVNALPVGSSPSAASIGTDATDVTIGNDKTLVSPFDGYIDDVRIYSRALSQVEIRQIMQGDRVAKYATTPDASGSLATSLIGHWTMDGPDINWASGRLTDKSGQGNHGTVVGMATGTAPADGKVGQALNFDGTNDYINAGMGADITGAVTISAWVNGNGSEADDFIAGRGNTSTGAASTQQYLLYYASTNQPAFRVSNGSAQISSLSGANGAPDGRWFHLVGVYDGIDTTRLYLNGVQVDTDTSASFGSLNSSAIGIGIGSRQTGGSNFHSGLIDDVRIYNRAFSVSEISKLYQSGKVTHNVSLPGGNSLENNLLGWWTFDGPDVNWATGRVFDKSVQGNSATIINMSTTSSPVEGRIGQAFFFDGIDDVVSASSPTILDDVFPLSISAWIKPESYGEENQSGIVGKVTSGAGGSGWVFATLITQARVQFFVNCTGADMTGRSVADSLTTSDFGKWMHLVVTWDGSCNKSGVQFFKNGVDISSSGGTDGSGDYVSDASNSFLIGANNIGPRTFDGAIDDVRFYNRVLSASEVKQLYSGRR